MSDNDNIAVGDHVYVGEGKEIWDVVALGAQGEKVLLRSGLIGWYREEPRARLHLHSRASS